MQRTTKVVFTYIITAVMLLVLFVIAVRTGSIKVSVTEVYNGLFVKYDQKIATIYDLRFPRIFIAMLGGAAMAVSGVLLQAVMKNPLADPGIIGVSSGASFAAVLVTAFFPLMYNFTPLFACIGGCTACALVYMLSWKSGLSPETYTCRCCINTMFTGLMRHSIPAQARHTAVWQALSMPIHSENMGRFQTSGLLCSGWTAALAVCNEILQPPQSGGQNCTFTRHKRYGYTPYYFIYCLSACVHLNSSYRSYQLPRTDRSPYRKTSGRQQS